MSFKAQIVAEGRRVAAVHSSPAMAKEAGIEFHACIKAQVAEQVAGGKEEWVPSFQADVKQALADARDEATQAGNLVEGAFFDGAADVSW